MLRTSLITNSLKNKNVSISPKNIHNDFIRICQTNNIVLSKSNLPTRALCSNVELSTLLTDKVKSCNSALKKENEELRNEVSELRKVLSQYENVTVPEKTEAPGSLKQPEASEPKKPKKGAKEDAGKASKPAKVDSEAAAPIDVGRLDFRIGLITSVEKHPDADSLYVEKVEVGEAQPRTVVSGLVKHMPASDLMGKMVVLLCNLKPAKMRGITSEAMVMCASTPEKVEVLIPPEGCVPGDLVTFDGYLRNPDSVLNPKKKIFETCAPDLKTDGSCVASYKNVPFVVPGKGPVVSKSLSCVQIK